MSGVMNETYQEIASRLQEEHAHLKQWLENVRVALADTSGEVNALRVLDEFLEEVEEHFRREEEDEGFCDAVFVVAPRLADKASTLMRQHAALLGALLDLQKMVREGDDQEIALKRFDTFAAKWLHHESEENKILQDAYNEDVGTAD